jgi:hypothetical protein
VAPVPVPASARAPRPNLGRRRPIDEYTPAQLRRLIAWIESDGMLRTDEEVVEDMVRHLGFRRRGPRIESTLHAAVADYRARGNRA